MARARSIKGWHQFLGPPKDSNSTYESSIVNQVDGDRASTLKNSLSTSATSSSSSTTHSGKSVPEKVAPQPNNSINSLSPGNVSSNLNVTTELNTPSNQVIPSNQFLNQHSRHTTAVKLTNNTAANSSVSNTPALSSNDHSISSTTSTTSTTSSSSGRNRSRRSRKSRRSSISQHAHQLGDHLFHLVQETHEHHSRGRKLLKEHEKGLTAAKKWHNQIHYQGVGINWGDCYLQYLTTMTWPGMMLLFGAVIYVQLMGFASLYWLCDYQYFSDLENGKFDAWNLAVQTYLTIGYGILTPEDTWWAVMWGVYATSVALLDVAIVTGVPYIKFSKPRCKVMFSSIITVNMHQGVPILTIRMANLHATPIFNLACTLYVVSMDKTIEGISVIQPIKLNLVTENVLVFQYNFVLQHKLNEESPLYNIWKTLGDDNISEEPLNLSLHVTVQGNDALLQKTVHAHHIYHINDFLFDSCFSDMVIPKRQHLGLPPLKDNNKKRRKSMSIAASLGGGGGGEQQDEGISGHSENTDRRTHFQRADSYNFLTKSEDSELDESLPQMVLACGKIDDTAVAKYHIKDPVIRKVADAMALHHLGEKKYHQHLNNDKRRVKQNHDVGKRLEHQNGNQSKTEERAASRASVASFDLRNRMENEAVGSRGSMGKIRNAKQMKQRRTTDAHVSEISHRHSVFQFMTHHDKNHNELLRSISFKLGAHRDNNGHIVSEKTHNRKSLAGINVTDSEGSIGSSQQKSRKISKKKHGHACCEDDCRVCCCSYGTFRRCCFLVDDVESCQDIRCCCRKFDDECGPNAFIKIPVSINHTILDDPAASVRCCCCLNPRLSEWYYAAVRMRLSILLLLVFSSYVLYIFFFGLTVFLLNFSENKTLIYPGYDDVNKTNSGPSFRLSFALAHQTISTIGYGHIAPATDSVHIAIFFYGSLGLIFCSLLVAIIWSRVTAVRPVMAFSNTAVVSKWNGKLALRFKIAGLWRPKPILTGHASVNAVLSTQDESGMTISRLVDLPLVTAYNPLMVLPWTVVHVIDQNSPLYTCNESNWTDRVHLLTVVFTGMDSCTGNEISAMFAYPSRKVVWDHRFATSFDVNPISGLITVDMNKFHELRPTLTIYLLVLQRQFFKKMKKLIKRRRTKKYGRSKSDSQAYYKEVTPPQNDACDIEMVGSGDIEMVGMSE